MKNSHLFILFLYFLLSSSCSPLFLADREIREFETYQDGYDWAYENQIENSDDCEYLSGFPQIGCYGYVDQN
jgi:hypothetical protein